MQKNLNTAHIKYYIILLGIGVSLLILISGCATPQIVEPSHTKILQPDQDDDMGGSFMESGDIRTVASQMSASLLSSTALAQKDGIFRIALAPIRNNTRFIIDKDIFMKRLRLEMNKVADGKVRFFSQKTGQKVRSEILQEQDEDIWDSIISEVASFIAMSDTVTNATNPLKVAVIPVKNTNIVGLNADSFTALIRAHIAEKARGKVAFLSREENGRVINQILRESDLRNLGLVESVRNNMVSGVDYFLGGEFIAKSLSLESVSISSTKRPNTATYLNMMLIDAQTGVIPVEKIAKVERKMKSGLGKSDFILTGELSALTKAATGGNRSDYVIMSFQLVDPLTNEVVWEDAYETKKVTKRSILYK